MADSIESYKNLEPLFHPRGIGIIGAGISPIAGGYFFRAMRGRIRVPMYLFNPKHAGKELLGEKCYNSVLDDELKGVPIDYAILSVKAQLCPLLMEELGQKGVKFVTIFASGFGEVGNHDLETQVLSVAKKYNIRIIGPNCLGIYYPEVGLYIGGSQSKKSGNFSAVFQSGGLAINTAQLAVSYGVYVSKIISIGNAIDLSHSDFLEYFLHDPKTRIIGFYIEHLKDVERGRRFMKAAVQCNLARKPVILWRAGYGEATKQAIHSHTGGLAGDNRIWEAMAKQTGCSLVENSTELAALASAFKLTRLPASRNIGLIGIGGGSTIEAGDALEKHNLKIPRLTEKSIKRFSRFLSDVNTNVNNPLDLGAEGAYPHIYYRVIAALDKDPNIDAIVFVKDPERFSKISDTVLDQYDQLKGVDVSKIFIKFMAKARKICKKPIYCVSLKIREGFEEYKSRYKFKLQLLNRGIPVYESFNVVAKVLDRLNTYREFLEKHGQYPK